MASDSCFDHAPSVFAAVALSWTGVVAAFPSSTLRLTVEPGSAVPLSTTVCACSVTLPLHTRVGLAGATVSLPAGADADATEVLPAASVCVAVAVIGPSDRPEAFRGADHVPSPATGDVPVASWVPSVSVTATVPAGPGAAPPPRTAPTLPLQNAAEGEDAAAAGAAQAT